MKKILLGAALLIGASSMYAQVVKIDPATYDNVDGVTLTNSWINSSMTENFTKIGVEVRAMAFANGKLYFADRAVNYVAPNPNATPPVAEVEGVSDLHVYNAATGILDKVVRLPSSVFSKVAFNNNCIVTDSKGNLILSNIVFGIQGGKIQLWVLADENDAAPVLKEVGMENEGETGWRIDYINVYGDINGDGYVLGALAGTATQNKVLRWDVVAGVISADPIVINITEYAPSNVAVNGGAPWVLPINDNTFFLDGGHTYPTMYNMNGALLDGFPTTPLAELPAPAGGANGVARVTLDGATFLIMGTNNHGAETTFKKNSFGIYKMGESGGFDGAKLTHKFPAAGLGAVTNSATTVLPFVEKISEKEANIYVYAYNNGFAKYTLKYEDPSGIEGSVADAENNVSYLNGQFVVANAVASIEVYNLAGQLVLSAQNTAFVDAPALEGGLYIAKTTGLTGNVTAQKVLVK